MKIVHLVDYFMPKLGYQECLLAKYHAKKYETHILTSDKFYPFPNYKESYQKMMGKRQQKAGQEENNNYKIHRLKSFFEIPSSTLILYKDINKKLKRLQPDILICHGLIKPTTFWACWYKKKHPQCTLILDHHEAIYNTNLSDSFLKRIYIRCWKAIIRPMILKYADKIIATGPNEKEFAIKYLFDGKDYDKFKIVTLGADEEIFFDDSKKREKMRKKLGFNDDEVVIINAGKINPSKKSFELIQVFHNVHAKYPKSSLVFVGGGDTEYLKKIEKYIKENDLQKNIILQGFIPNNELPDYLNMADIGCWPGSRSNIFWEAMACGLPLILENKEYAHELINNKNGAVIEKEENLESILEKFIADKNLRKEMSNNSKELFQNKYSYTNLCEEFIK